MFSLQNWVPAQIVPQGMMGTRAVGTPQGFGKAGGNGSSSQHLSAGLPVYEMGQYVERSWLHGEG